MADAFAFKDWILEAIDQLRKRKARPDLDRICHMLERRHGIGFAEVQAQLEALVQADVVIKVDYKGSTSYRNAAKWIKTVGRNVAGQVLDSNDVSAAIGQALRKLKNGTGGTGVSIREIQKQLSSENSSASRLCHPDTLTQTLEREVACGRIRKTLFGHYAIPAEHLPHSPKGDLLQTTDSVGQRNSDSRSALDGSPACNGDAGGSGGGSSTSKTKETSKEEKDFEVPNKKSKDGEERRAEQTQRTKRPASPVPVGRPGSRRKRVKKYHGPDFIDSSSLPSPDGLDTDDPHCDYCFLPSTANPRGESEDLLRCTDCNAKAHPSCMEYSPELAKKSRLAPWQCMDCKTCTNCQGAVSGDCMLFCDSCDRGYHMKCHQPKIIEKPTGKWLCSKCVPAEPKQQTVSLPTAPTRGRPRRGTKPSPVLVDVTTATAGLPTPCDSPVSDFDSSPECDEKMDATKLNLQDCEMDQYPESIPDAKDWTIHDVANFFTMIGFPEQAPAFKDQEIDGKSLLLMKRSDVLTGLSIRLGPALKIYNHIKRLQTGLPDGHLAVH